MQHHHRKKNRRIFGRRPVTAKQFGWALFILLCLSGVVVLIA